MLKGKYKLFIGSIALVGAVCFSGILDISNSWNLVNAEDINGKQVEKSEDDIIKPNEEKTTVIDDYILESKGYSTNSKEEHEKLKNQMKKKAMQSGATVYTLSDDGVHILSDNEQK